MSSPGSKFCSISSGAALKWVRNLRSATARAASGRRSAKSTQAPASKLLGSQDGQRLEQLPKGLQKKAKGRLQDIWMAPGRIESAFDFFLEAYGPKYDKAAACLAGPRRLTRLEASGSMYARPTPSEHSPRSMDQGLPVAQDGDGHGLQTMPVAQRKWRKLDGSNHLAEIIRGVT